MNPYEKIIELLKSNDLWFEEIKHEPVYTSQQAASVRGLKLEQGAKSLLFKADQDFILVVLGGDKKVDWKKLKNVLSVRQIRMATPEEVVQKMGVEVGACYPFGNIVGLRTLVDKSLTKQEIISCNPGRHDVSIKFMLKDYQKLVQPELTEVS
ncbi:MAG TPA: YbaK/EbsC family protein [Candidatus Saccharimonadales bacterium]|nr:YbaK/EbsC family protein [Candidatus Saccharimonadales bacterium]